MSNETAVMTKEDHAPAVNQVTQKMCDDFLFQANTKLTEQQKTMFYNLALQFNLNPFKREIHAIKYGDGFNFVTGYQVYVARAESTGKLNGWSSESMITEKGELFGARLTIFRTDWEHPFVWEVALAEFNKGTGNWKVMPEFMIKKVAIGQGFRLAFPNELGGMPYLAEELEDAKPHGQHQREPIKSPQSKADADGETHSDNPPDGPVISEAQGKRFYAIARGAGFDDATLKQWLIDGYKIDSTKKILKTQYENICISVAEGPENA